MTTTISQLLSELQGGSWENTLKALQSSPAWTRLRRNLKPHGILVNSAGAFGTIAERIPDLLHLDLGAVLVGGWKKSAELQRYADREKYPPDETVLVELSRHSVSSSHKPSLDIVVNGHKVDTILFELGLTITIDSALLTIRDGRILGMLLGECKAEGEFRCEGYEIFKRESAPVRLPGTWTFKEPIEIRT